MFVTVNNFGGQVGGFKYHYGNKLEELYRSELESELANILGVKIEVTPFPENSRSIGLEYLTTDEHFLCIKCYDKVSTIFPFLKEAHFPVEFINDQPRIGQIFKDKGYRIICSSNPSSPKDLINETRKFCLGSPKMRDV